MFSSTQPLEVLAIRNSEQRAALKESLLEQRRLKSNNHVASCAFYLIDGLLDSTTDCISVESIRREVDRELGPLIDEEFREAARTVQEILEANDEPLRPSKPLISSFQHQGLN